MDKSDHESIGRRLPSSVAPANSALDTQPAAGDTVVEIAAENETASQVRLTGTLPGGYAYAVDVSVLADGVRLVPLVSNEPLGTYTPQRPLDESSTFTIVVSGASGSGQGVSGVIATTENPAATQLRVTRITGERYITDLQSIAGQPAVKFSAVLMPKRQLASADLVDADGNILSTWTS